MWLPGLILQLITTQGPDSAALPPISQAILANFEAIDRNADGTLQLPEVAQAIRDPQYHGQASAAICAIVIWNNECAPLPPLTKEWFQNYRPVKQPAAPANMTPAQRRVWKQQVWQKGFALQQAYKDSLWHILRAPHALYTTDGPQRYQIKQGQMTDADILAALAAITQRNPEEVRRMIRPSGDGYDVQFADGQLVHVPDLTDAQMGLGGAWPDWGRWVRVIEQAWIRRKPYPANRVPWLPKGHRGLLSPPVGFTNHRFTWIPLIGSYAKPVSPGAVKGLANTVRTQILAAGANRKIGVCDTTGNTGLASIPNGLWFTVTAYDPTTDEISVWTAWGDAPAPKQNPGYPRIKGITKMPLEVFVRAFRTIGFETDLAAVVD